MDRQTFEALPFEKQLEYVNKKSFMTVKQISEEIKDMPPSSLSKIFAQKGYRRAKGFYIKMKQTPQLISSEEHSKDPLQELLRYKDQLIAMVLRDQEQHHQSNQFDFSFLEQLNKSKTKKTITFDLPEELANELDRVIAKKGLKKQALMSLVVYQFLQSYK
ncbi:hypothetical protein GLW20_08610 [Virgibacillus halodenitrificans]|nr:hypothetical protein [Virgibacillus halodenitrificans]